MAQENNDIQNAGGEHKPEAHKHTSWLGHIVDEVKEKFEELVEEAQNDGGEFSALGNGHINVVHDHHEHPATEAAAPPAEKAEAPKEEKTPGQHHESWLGHIVDEVKEKFSELVEEAQNDGGEFSALGNGHINVVHDHHEHPQREEKKDEQ